jgi:phage tail tape-measure protein
MATVGTRTVEGSIAREESFASQALAFVAMAGAVAGALAGAVLGAEVGSAFPVLWGGTGTMLGSGLTAGAWCLFTDLWNNEFVGYETGHARAQQSVTPSASTQ